MTIPKTLAVLAFGASLAMLAPAAPASAQYASGYLPPVPSGGHYRLSVFGDSLAAGLAPALASDLSAQDIVVVNKTAPGAGITRADGADWDKTVAALPPGDAFQIAVVLIGADDRLSMYVGGKRLPIGSDVWSAEYARRVDAFIKAIQAKGAVVYWLGLPPMRSDGGMAEAKFVNEIFLERTRLDGARFVPSWAGFADQDGGYLDQGPDMTGAVKQLRLSDGVHMTDPGYRKLANFVEREIERDLAIAQKERDVPLAGDESEQRNVRDESIPTPANAASGQSQQVARSRKDIPAADSSVSLAGSEGAPIAILRPAIPAALLTAFYQGKASASGEPGRPMAVDLMGGFTALSSLATLSEGAGGARPVSENPFYKLLIRGDSLAPQPGRVDDFSWPKTDAAKQP